MVILIINSAMSKLYGKPTDAGNMYVDTLMSISAGAFYAFYVLKSGVNK